MTVVNDEIFLVDELQAGDGSIHAKLSINKNSTILNGHFPGQPVVPGACMLQLVKDILERVLETTLLLKKADYLKFINMMVPGNCESITLDIFYNIFEDQIIKATGKISSRGSVCFKFQGAFICLPA